MNIASKHVSLFGTCLVI